LLIILGLSMRRGFLSTKYEARRKALQPASSPEKRTSKLLLGVTGSFPKVGSIMEVRVAEHEVLNEVDGASPLSGTGWGDRGAMSRRFPDHGEIEQTSGGYTVRNGTAKMLSCNAAGEPSQLN
jgi:hypothetical protein